MWKKSPREQRFMEGCSSISVIYYIWGLGFPVSVTFSHFLKFLSFLNNEYCKKTNCSWECNVCSSHSSLPWVPVWRTFLFSSPLFSLHHYPFIPLFFHPSTFEWAQAILTLKIHCAPPASHSNYLLPFSENSQTWGCCVLSHPPLPLCGHAFSELVKPRTALVTMASVGTISSSWNFVFSLSMTLLSYSLLVSLAGPLGSITSSFSSSHALKVEISQDGLKS
jgi:hypothetical protein